MQNAANSLQLDQTVERDVYTANREVNVNARIDGDLVAAGQTVTVVGDVTGDIIVGAQTVDIQGAVLDDVRAAGQHIRVRSPVSGHIVAAGQTVTIDQPVGDWAWIAGNTVNVNADVSGELSVRANAIALNSLVQGDADFIGDSLQLGPDAVVRGDLRWRSSNEADISPDAQIDGEFIHEPMPEFAEEVARGGGVKFTLKIIVSVAVLFLLFPAPLRATSARIAGRPVVTLVLGVAILATLPVLAILLFVTGLGTWLGFAVLGIYPVALLLGVFAGLYALSDLALRGIRSDPPLWQALAAIAVTVSVVGLVSSVPWAGITVVMLIWLLGLGALGWNAWAALQSYRTGETVAGT